jgi:D-sedoheptulose 7-phosphate isomerase
MLTEILEQHHAAIESLRPQWPVLYRMAQTMYGCMASEGTVYLCGNGGSAADCQHIAAELVGRFGLERPGLPAIALTTDTSILTAVGNDYGYTQVFKRQVQAFLKPDDVLVCLSTSGNSANVVQAAYAARYECEATVLALTGGADSELSRIAHETVKVAGANTARVQEAHILCGHILCQIIDGEYASENGLD